MARISIQLSKVKYDSSTKTFSVKGSGITFGTVHELHNTRTNESKQFNLSHSTGSEWDKNTKWIYESVDGFILEVGNDDVTKTQQYNYLNAKLRN